MSSASTTPKPLSVKEEGEALITTAIVEVRPLSDTVLPPVSSKVLKTIIESRRGALAEIARANKPYKPLHITMLYRGPKPLYSRGETPLTARQGEPLLARITIASRDDWSLVDEIISLEGTHHTGYGGFRVEVAELLQEKPQALTLPSPTGAPTGILYIKACTPVTITPKILYRKPPAKKTRDYYRLLPTPGLIAAYTHRLWSNTVQAIEKPTPHQLAAKAEKTVTEIDYNLTPTTIIIGRDRNKNLRKTRGWTGWIIYRIPSRKLAQILDTLIALSTRLGLGRSRGIGLGNITAEWRQPQKHQTPPTPRPHDCLRPP